MANGPPPSQAGSSQKQSDPSETSAQRPTLIVPLTTLSSTPSSQLQPVQYGPATQGQSPQGYYTMNYASGGWQNPWQVPSYPFIASGSAPGQQSHYTQVPYGQYQPPTVSYQPRQRQKVVQKPRSPTPEPEFHRHWDEVVRSFLKKVGLNQALRGFEDDMVVMNADWERQKVPGAIGDLMRDLMNLGKTKDGETFQERPLEERKLDYIHLSNGAEPQSQTSVTKSISQFLAQNRARNDASNRVEFLESLAQKRRRLNLDSDNTESIPSCARTDAKHLDRDVQMRYDIAKNEDGPLRRTVKGVTGEKGEQPKELCALHDEAEGNQQPATDQRVRNIEEHLAVRYVPAPPRTLMFRLRLLEDHIIQLEKDYPPWAALHFNQPNRGWPPPPRQTPIIVPPHITTVTKDPVTDTPQETSSSTPSDEVPHVKAKNKNKSSLHRAVMEKLEIQKAMSDLASARTTTH